MPADFNQALQFVLKHEGGYFSDPTTGEVSNYGITGKWLASLNYRTTDPRTLTPTDAANIYQSYIWGPQNLSQINSQLLAQKIFDMMVNMGAFQATKCVQRALIMQGLNAVVDGRMGPFTITSINTIVSTLVDGEMRLLAGIVNQCETFYQLIAKGPKEKYLTGWLVRARDIGVQT